MTGRIRTLIAATAVAAAATAPAAVSAASPLTFSQFTSPTGNIGCVINSEGVRCDIQHRSWTPPARHHCVHGGDFGNSFDVADAGRGQLICVTDTTLDPHAHVLAYGTSITRGRIMCSSAATGMTCRNTRDGHGFFVSIQSYRLF